jgi:polar amino acid transport system substrate-binding protein
MRRLAKSVVAWGVACAVAAGEASSGAAEIRPPDPGLPQDLAKVYGRGKLLVAMVADDTPPFFMQRDGVLEGVDVEIARGLARELGVPVEFDRSAKSFNQVVERVARGKADLGISKLSRTFSRARRVMFSEPYVRVRHGLLLNRKGVAQRVGDGSVADLVRNFRGRLAVLDGTSYMDFAARNFPQATIVPYQTWAEVVEAVSTDSVLGAYRDEMEIKKVALDHPRKALQLQAVSIADKWDEKAIALPFGSPNLLALVNLYLENSNTKLTAQDLLRRYGEYMARIR